MDKLCCGNVEPPNITVKVSCPSSCCESRLEEKDSVDGEAKLPTPPPSPEKTTVSCCCFIIKRHANEIDRNSNCLKDGGETSQDLL